MHANPLELPLRDIHLPPSISWWPVSPGWWIVLTLLLLTIFFIFFLIKFLRKPSLKKEAEQALNRIEKKLTERQQAIECLAELSILLRRLMLDKKIISEPAALTGIAWLEALDKPLKQPEFSQGVGRILLTGPYQKEVQSEEVSQLIQLCRKWIKMI